MKKIILFLLSPLLLAGCTVSVENNPPKTEAPQITAAYQCPEVLLKATGNSDQLELLVGEEGPFTLKRSDDLGNEFSGEGLVFKPGPIHGSLSREGELIFENCPIVK